MTANKPPADEVARMLGMKPREVVDVQLDADGVLAQTHDGNWTLIRDSGTFDFLGQDLSARTPIAEPDAAAKKPAPKGRS